MKSLRRSLIAAVAVLGLSVGIAGTALATPSPTGSPGQPGSTGGTTCQVYPTTPGNSTSAGGSVFNFSPTATAGMHYAGNTGTHSLISNNPKAVSQYDIACFQASQH
jgi:hypothetical protein